MVGLPYRVPARRVCVIRVMPPVVPDLSQLAYGSPRRDRRMFLWSGFSTVWQHSRGYGNPRIGGHGVENRFSFIKKERDKRRSERTKPLTLPNRYICGRTEIQPQPPEPYESMDTNNVKTVTICDTEPIAIEGVRALLETRRDLMLAGTESSIASGLDMVKNLKPAVVII